MKLNNIFFKYIIIVYIKIKAKKKQNKNYLIIKNLNIHNLVYYIIRYKI